ncbi:reverse transcriptase domain-containing protein, partial [Tanacetum coccineum]
NSNNDAEYKALLEGLRIATWMKVKKMQAFADSKLVASQISHIPREKNKKANALSKLAAVQCEGLTKGVLVEELNERSMDVVKVNVIVEEEGKMWMTPIREYIEKGTLSDDSTEASTIREKVNILRCIGPLQANCVIREIHIGSCRMHDGQRRVVHKAMNAWKWIIDIVGPLPEALEKLKYLIVAVDYFTKWLKAKPVASITGRQVKNFAFDNIVFRFGVMAIIITDNGTQLINEPFKSWAEGLEIKLISTSVYHPQANRAVERANQSIMQGIKTRLHHLAYGTESIIPVDIGMPTRRTTRGTDEENDVELRLNLNLLEKRREIAIIREARQRHQVEKYYNQRVHHKGEFVLRKDEVSKAKNTVKLGPKWEGPYEVIEAYGT